MVPFPHHQALIQGPAHLRPLRRGGSYRLEGPGLFSLRLKPHLPAWPLEGVYRVHLWFRTDREGHVVRVLLRRAEPLGEGGGEGPLRFLLRGRFLGEKEGIGRVRVVPADARSFTVAYLRRRPLYPPPPVGSFVLVMGTLHRGRLLGEEVVVLARALPPPRGG
ncbi:hypothetical protein [Thermus sp.]|uniref:hypothetical protein n=1 Tax=Thermus sp. TaxID=275 RepID=UPI00307D8966